LKRSNIMLAILLMGLLLIGGNAAGQMNSSTEDAAGTAQTAQVQGIWSISLKGTEQVTLALHQDGNTLFGSATSDADRPWNAAVLGQISGDQIELTMTSLLDRSIVSMKLVGTIESESFKGSFVQADDQGAANSGLFTAVLINPDITAYAPAKIESPAETSVLNPETAVAENTDVASAATSKTQPTQLGNPKYRDVHTMAGTVPENLGVGFIGDGTMGAGGMGMG
jgi:hypothetical protein